MPVPDEALERLKRMLDMIPARSPRRKEHVLRVASSYGCSVSTVYAQLQKRRPAKKKRKDYGLPRRANEDEFIRWIEIIAAIKHRSTNKKNHHLSTSQAIDIAEKGFVDSRTGGSLSIPRGSLTRQTCDRWLAKLKLNKTGSWESPSVRFGATSSNVVWQFDISPSDTYYIDTQAGLTEKRSMRLKSHVKRPKLMLFSVIDDFSRVEYMEYHLCFGEDAETALRFLFRAMAKKDDRSFPFQGLPDVLYMDNGSIPKSGVFLQVMGRLGIEVKLHETPDKAKRRTAARSKGKIERSFRSCKNSFESLFQFHKPQDLNEANECLCAHMLNIAYAPHPFWESNRIDVWHEHLPSQGIREMCDWDSYRDLARKPHRRVVSNDGLVVLDKQQYQVDDEFRGNKVEIWRGILDDGLYLRTDDNQIFGPFNPVPTPLPFGKFRKPKKSKNEQMRSNVINLAGNIKVSKEVLFADTRTPDQQQRRFTVIGKAVEPESPTGALHFETAFEAKHAVFITYGVPLGKLSRSQRGRMDQLLKTTLRRDEVLAEAKKIIDELTNNAARNT